MKRNLYALFLALVLVLAIGSASLAAPFVPGYEGQVMIFGDYNIMDGFSVGAGYNVADGFAVGAQYLAVGNSWPYAYGGFAAISLYPLILQGELMYFPLAPFTYGDASALYAIDLYPMILGLGGGASIGPWGTDYYLEAAASLAASETLSLYGSVSYFPAYADIGYTAGMSIVF